MNNGMKNLIWTMVVFCLLLVGAQQALERGLPGLLEVFPQQMETHLGSHPASENEMLPEPEQPGETSQAVYEAVRTALMEGASSLELSVPAGSMPAEEIFAIVEQVVHQNPEILYYEGVKYWSHGRLEFSYRKDRPTILAHQRAVRNQVESIIKREIRPGMSEYDRVLAIHDYIIKNTRYDMENLRQGTLPPEASSPYGVLVQGSGVCEGYAKAMKIIMDQLGIPCLYVTGRAGGEGHAWNMVALEGRYYHIDLTWNDPVMPDGTQVLRYDYFCVTDRELEVSHTWDRQAFPACTSGKHNYYYQRGLVVRNYEEFYELLYLALKNRAKNFSFRVPDFNERDFDLVATIDKILSDNRRLSHKGYTYRLPENRRIGVINLHFK